MKRPYHQVLNYLAVGDFLGLPKLEQLVDDKGKPTGTRMIIRAVTRYNTGRYECTAINPHGQDKKSLDLDVWQIWEAIRLVPKPRFIAVLEVLLFIYNASSY